MDYTQILYEKQERIALVTLNRPHVRNAQSRLLLEELDAAFAEAARDDGVRCVVLRGAGEHFSSGHDLGSPEEVEDTARRPWPEGSRGHMERSWALYVENSLRWRDLPKPTIASVHGFCIFGGYLIASVMDLIVAAEDARFLPAHLQLFTAPWDMEIRKCKEILFQNRFIGAHEALEIGLVNRVVPREQLEKETLELAGRISKNDLLTLRVLKRSINSAQDAMGYRTSIEAAHGGFMTLALGGRVQQGDPRRLKGVENALRGAKKGPADG